MDDLFARFEAIGRDLEARQSRPVEYERAAMESYMEALGPGDAPFLLPRAFNEVRQEYRATRNVPQIMAPSDLQTTNIFPRVVAFGPTTKPTTAIQHDSEDEEDDQETGGPESNQDSDLSANSVRWDGKIIAVADFLGDRWSRRIVRKGPRVLPLPFFEPFFFFFFFSFFFCLADSAVVARHATGASYRATRLPQNTTGGVSEKGCRDDARRVAVACARLLERRRSRPGKNHHVDRPGHRGEVSWTAPGWTDCGRDAQASYTTVGRADDTTHKVGK